MSTPISLLLLPVFLLRMNTTSFLLVSEKKYLYNEGKSRWQSILAIVKLSNWRHDSEIDPSDSFTESVIVAMCSMFIKISRISTNHSPACSCHLRCRSKSILPIWVNPNIKIMVLVTSYLISASLFRSVRGDHVWDEHEFLLRIEVLPTKSVPQNTHLIVSLHEYWIQLHWAARSELFVSLWTTQRSFITCSSSNAILTSFDLILRFGRNENGISYMMTTSLFWHRFLFSSHQPLSWLTVSFCGEKKIVQIFSALDVKSIEYSSR